MAEPRAYVPGLIACVLTLTSANVAHAQAPRGAYAGPQQLVKLPDGRAINLVCLGSGSPTVILLTGLALESNSWIRVQGEIAKTTRVCAFDRPGYGFSDPGPLPQDAGRIATDLEATLRAADIAGPVVLVGHSLGGSFARMFANLHPAEVAGMILIDPVFDHEAALIAKATGAPEEVVDASGLACIRAIAAGEMKSGGANYIACGSQPADRPRDIAKARAVLSEMESLEAIDHQVIGSARSWRDTPLIILAAGADPGPQASASARAFFQLKPIAYAAMARQSSRGQVRTVEGAGHIVQFERPQAVLGAIAEVVSAARQAQH
jgi:pimeloyl-ACP methyl ester carboxylesterase